MSKQKKGRPYKTDGDKYGIYIDLACLRFDRVSKRECAKLLKVSERTIYNYLNDPLYHEIEQDINKMFSSEKENRYGADRIYTKRGRDYLATLRREKPMKKSPGWLKLYERNPFAIDEKYASHIKREYNLSLQDYYALAIRQDGKCAVCGKEERLLVDHDHNTGEVRGLLCTTCNTGLGHLGDNSEGVSKATRYLQDKGEIKNQISKRLRERQLYYSHKVS